MTGESHRLIVARYKENVDWVRAFDNFTIYNKGVDDLPDKCRDNSISMTNVGREAHSYIHHIVENYESLEDILVFSQGDYSQHIACSPKEFAKRALDIGDVGFSTTLGRSGHIGTNARNFVLHEYQGTLKTRRPYDLGGWWESTTGEAYARSRSVFWNAIFSVRREFIRRRSRQSYQRILDTLSWSANPMEAHFCERTWFNILNLPLTFVMDPEFSLIADPPKPHRPEVAPPIFLPGVESHPTEKEDSFGVQGLLDRWLSLSSKKSRPSIAIKRKSAIRQKASPLISRGEVLGLLDKVREIMSSDEAQVKNYTDALRHNIEEWTSANCPAYPLDKPFVSKEDLANKLGWYVGELSCESMEVSTTGSTTGVPFKYMRWLSAFNKIEWDYHYDFVLDEFGVRQDPNILYFFSDHFKSDGTKPIYCQGTPSNLTWNNHGATRSPIVHYVNFPIYQKDQEAFFSYMFEYVREHEIDVFFTSSPQISSMCNYIRKLGISHKIGKMISSTGDRILPADAKFLFLDNNYFDDACDHMRCWDGGATFYTCKFRNYHLMDNLSWVEEVDGKMICTDYFNLASPFVRYWNGDYCKVGKEYHRCECGRLYREFEFMESRPFSLKGVSMKEIKDGMKALGIPGIKEVRCAQSHLDVVSVSPISKEDRAKIASLSDKFPFRFLTEEFHS